MVGKDDLAARENAELAVICSLLETVEKDLPRKLTEEEFETMKEHPMIGGKIIRDTFGHLFNGIYESMAYQVAMYHHEKWNGKGYPEGLSGTDFDPDIVDVFMANRDEVEKIYYNEI